MSLTAAFRLFCLLERHVNSYAVLIDSPWRSTKAWPSPGTPLRVVLRGLRHQMIKERALQMDRYVRRADVALHVVGGDGTFGRDGSISRSTAWGADQTALVSCGRPLRRPP